MYLLKIKNYTFDLANMFTDKLGGIELPHLQNIKIEENLKLFAIYAILENKIKTIQVFVHYLMQKEKYAVENAFFDEIFGKFWLF